MTNNYGKKKQKNGSVRFIMTIMIVFIVSSIGGEAVPEKEEEPIPFIVPLGKGQLESNANWFEAGKKMFGHDILYGGQAASNSKIRLTASNGFFSGGISAAGEPEDADAPNTKEFIWANYRYLRRLKSGSQMRWHLWFDQPGSFRVVPSLEVNKALAGAELRFSFADQEHVIKTEHVPAPYRQSCDMVFKVPEKGKYVLTVDVLKTKVGSKDGIGKLYHIDLLGPAIKSAKLLRARWRPAAVHSRYRSSNVKNVKAWIMTTKSNADISSYSPITTPFGYYGSSFDSSGRSGNSFNFSMWSYAKGKEAPPTERLSHLLALGSPEAEFSGFGHEGSGVKPRNFVALPTKPKEVTLYLRLEQAGNYHRYYGYFLDPETRNWKLFAVGNKWRGGYPYPYGDRGGKEAENLYIGSFVEVPGPPQSQRSGDLRREMHRKGWMMDQDGKWHRIDSMSAGRTTHHNKYWGVSEDGWFLMGMGGMEHFALKAGNVELPEKFADEPFPDFLAPEKVKQLYKLPVSFGAIKASDTSASTAEINLDLDDAGTNAKAIVYYGEEDFLTFARRKGHGTEGKKGIKGWSYSKDIGSVKTGKNPVSLQNLKPGTKYFYRILVTNNQGKMWTFETHDFTMKKK